MSQHTATFSLSSLRFYAELLDNVQLPSHHPQLVELAQQVTVAREELRAALESAAAEVPHLDVPLTVTAPSDEG